MADTHTGKDRGVVASQCGRSVRVVVDRRETFPGNGVGVVECVKRRLPDASLEAVKWGHVNPATTAPDVETVGAGVIDGGCADTGLGKVSERGGRVE